MSPFIRLLGSAVNATVLSVCLSAPALAAWPHEPNNGNLPVCTATGDQTNPKLVSDGVGGAFVAWQDRRGGNYDIYVQRVNAAGVPQWTANGVVLCSATGDQIVPSLVADGAGGAIVTWQDLRSGTSYDVYAQRVNAAGAPQWTANGALLCNATNDQSTVGIVSDGVGGAIVTWVDARSGTNTDIYAQRVIAAGTTPWTANGVALCTAPGNQFGPMIASDGTSGAIVTWHDGRSGVNDIYAQRVGAAGTTQWIADGVALCNATGAQSGPTIVSDESGGAIITWLDNRGASTDIYAQRVSALGTAQWTANGAAVCTAANQQTGPVIAADGAGGAVIAWYDGRSGAGNDIYAQRMSAAGAPQWTANGVALSVAPLNQEVPAIVSDGMGGAIVAWHDIRSGVFWDVYAQRVNYAGVPQWATDGLAVSIAIDDQVFPILASDGAGGALITWYDHRSGAYDIYAQRVEAQGYLGTPEPLIASVRDVPGDQGGKVKLSWDASYLEFAPYSGVIKLYEIFRSVPPNYVAMATARGAAMYRGWESEEGLALGDIISAPTSTQTFFWEYLGSQSAFQFPGYSYLAATAQDSTAVSSLKTYFLVRAVSFTDPFWNSPPDSGYSVDNLGPVTPAPFAGAYGGGATHLHWGENHEADLAGYRAYRGASAGFVPGPGNLITAQADTGFSDVGPAGSYYKLSAVDVHGNESGYALLTPAGTVDVQPIVPRELMLALTSSNPARSGASFRFALPEAAPVRVSIYDLAGREVRELTRASLPPGEYAARWDGRDAAGHAASGGVYLARLRTGARARVVRFALVR